MAIDTSLGATELGAGKAQTSPAGDSASEMQGVPKKVDGKVQEVAGKARETIDQIADAATGSISKLSDQANAVVSKASDQAHDVYGRAAQGAQSLANTVNPYIEERPYAALAIAAAAGAIVGLLLFGRGPKVIYVKPRD